MNPWLTAPLTGALALVASLVWMGVIAFGALRIRTRIVTISRNPAVAALSQMGETGAVLTRVIDQLDQVKTHVARFGADVAAIAAAYARARILARKTLAAVDNFRVLFNL